MFVIDNLSTINPILEIPSLYYRPYSPLHLRLVCMGRGILDRKLEDKTRNYIKSIQTYGKTELVKTENKLRIQKYSLWNEINLEFNQGVFIGLQNTEPTFYCWSSQKGWHNFSTRVSPWLDKETAETMRVFANGALETGHNSICLCNTFFQRRHEFVII